MDNKKGRSDSITVDIEEMIVRIAEKYKICGMDIEAKTQEIRNHLIENFLNLTLQKVNSNTGP